jgi:exodeoxyribonuclease V alpha subunit
MQTANDYDKDVFNGDIGFVSGVDQEAQEITIDFDGRAVSYDFGELDEVLPPMPRPSIKRWDRNIPRW